MTAGKVQTPHDSTNLWRRKKKQQLDEELILSWADEHFQQYGVWPKAKSGPVYGQEGVKWQNVDASLTKGHRGLLPHSSLALLLEARRGVFRDRDLPSLTLEQILIWADLYFEKHGIYPRRSSGPIEGSGRETWAAVDCALTQGLRGLDGKSSLFKILNEYRGMGRMDRTFAPLTEDMVLTWADAHFSRNGVWPKRSDVLIADDQTETTWNSILTAMRAGSRGFTKGYSLRKLLEKSGRITLRKNLSVEQILSWSDVYHAKHGRYPRQTNEAVEGDENVTWSAVDKALTHGTRGLPGGSSLSKLFEEQRATLRLGSHPLVSIEQILGWMDDHHAQTGDWPNRRSGIILACPARKWKGVDEGLRNGLGGICEPTTLVQLPVIYRGKRDIRAVPKFTIEKIIVWTQAYASRHGKYPIAMAGPIDELPEESWLRVNSALYLGQRGLPGGQSLPQLRNKLIAEGKLPKL